MIILSVHNHYQQAGGEDASTALEVALLRSHGHEVVEYREHNDRILEMPRLQAASRTIWSRESYRNIQSLIRRHRPDVVHVQNFFPLISPAVYYAARSQRVPVVQTLRNFRLLCANGLFMRENRVCEDCMGTGGGLNAIAHSCYRSDRAATMVVVAMQKTHRTLGTWQRMVNTYIAMTEFSRRKMIAGGLPADRIVLKPNFVDPYPAVPRTALGSYALFVGRLSEEKGLRTLVDAWRTVQDLPLKIVGSGPLEDELRSSISAYGLGGQVELLGQRTPDEITGLLEDAALLVFPSLWYETFGRVAVEAFASAVPVVASRLGSMAELIVDGYNGLHFNPGDPADLSEKIRFAMADPERLRTWGKQARNYFESNFTADRNYQILMEIYDQAVRRGADGVVEPFPSGVDRPPAEFRVPDDSRLGGMEVPSEGLPAPSRGIHERRPGS